MTAPDPLLSDATTLFPVVQFIALQKLFMTDFNVPIACAHACVDRSFGFYPKLRNLTMES